MSVNEFNRPVVYRLSSIWKYLRVVWQTSRTPTEQLLADPATTQRACLSLLGGEQFAQAVLQPLPVNRATVCTLKHQWFINICYSQVLDCIASINAYLAKAKPELSIELSDQAVTS